MPSPLNQGILDLLYILAFHFKIKFIISFLLFNLQVNLMTARPC